jgi:predicted anti-sigma-YlaC factor YlaD
MDQEMNCEQIRPILLDFLMEEVPSAQRGVIESHLQGCGACSREMAELQETLSLVARTETSEEIPRKIRIVAEPVRPWAAFWRNPARLAFAGAGMFCLAIAFLALFHTTISYGNGNFQIAFGAPAVSSGAPRSGAAMPAAAVARPMDQAQIDQMIAKALAAAQADYEQRSGAMVQQASQRMQQQWRHDLGEMAQSMRYFQEAQTMLWKGQVQNEQLVSTLIEQSRPSTPQHP